MGLILTGRKLEATEALQMGLCNRVVPTGEALPAAIALADRVFVLWPTLAAVRYWASCFGSLTRWLARPLCGNVEWGRRPNTRSTSHAVRRARENL